MANVKFTELPVAASVTLDDVVPVVDLAGPTSQRASLTVIRAALVPVLLSGTDVSGILPVVNGGTGIGVLGAGMSTFWVTPSGANLAATLTTPLTIGAGGTGLQTVASGMDTFWQTASSANLAAVLTDETGTGACVFGTSPTLKTSIVLRNPADTFGYTITPAAIASNLALTLPLLVSGDTLVTQAFAQTLSNKTLASPTVTGTVIYQGTKFRILSIPGEVQTTTATTAVIATFTMLDETSCKVDFTASMKAVGVNAKAGGWTGSATYYRSAGGAPTITNGTPNYGTPEETTVGDGVTFDVSGNAVRVLATAADADDRNWTCEFRVAETLATA